MEYIVDVTLAKLGLPSQDRTRRSYSLKDRLSLFMGDGSVAAIESAVHAVAHYHNGFWVTTTTRS
eukprot:947965-Pyramimonas_sp.AAC.1